MRLGDIHVGDKLTIRTRFVWEVRTVTRVTKAFVVDSSGIKWTMRGQRWGHRWTSDDAVPWHPDHTVTIVEQKDRLECERRRNALANTRWRDLDPSVIAAVHSVLAKAGSNP